jgi:hypothetical protein
MIFRRATGNTPGFFLAFHRQKNFFNFSPKRSNVHPEEVNEHPWKRWPVLNCPPSGGFGTGMRKKRRETHGRRKNFLS